MIRDRNIEWLRQKYYIHANVFGFCATPASATFGEGAPVPTEVGSLAWGGLLIGAAGDTMAAPDFQLPSIIDPREELGIRVIWAVTGSGTNTTDDVTWIVKYDQFDIGVDAMSTGSVLDTAIAEQRAGSATQFICRRTSRGIINANTFDFTARQGGIFFEVECDAMDYAADKITFLALEIDYKPLNTANLTEDENVFAALDAA